MLRLRQLGCHITQAPTAPAPATATRGPFRVLLVGIDAPHGSAWRKSLIEAGEGRLQLVGLVPGFGGATCSLEEQYAGLPRFDTVGEAIRGLSFDGALVLLSNLEGPPAMVELAQAGKHIVVEKPGIGTVADGEAIVAAATANGVAVMPAFNNRFNQCARRLRRMVEHGQFGKLISFEVTTATTDVRLRNPSHYLFDPAQNKMAEGTGGYFSWLGCHTIDMVFFILRQPIVGVTAVVGRFGGTETPVEDGGTAIFELANGMIVTMIGGYWIPKRAGEGGWTVRGTERWVNWNGAELRIQGQNPQWDKLAISETYTAPEDTTTGYGQGACDLLNEWVNAARGGTAASIAPDAHAMVRVQQVLDAMYTSSQDGRRVEVYIE